MIEYEEHKLVEHMNVHLLDLDLDLPEATVYKVGGKVGVDIKGQRSIASGQ